MPNISQNNETEHINKKISLSQDRFKINEKSLNQFQNGLMWIGKIRVKQWQKKNLSQTKKKYKKYWKVRLSISKKRMIY